MLDFERRLHISTEPMPWTKAELPTYKMVEQWFLRNEHTTGFYSAFHDHDIFQIWTKEYITCLASEILSLVGHGLVLEVCAGDGCLTHWLQEHGVNAVATDNYSRASLQHFFSVEKLDALSAIDKYEPKLVIASWIEYDSILDLQMIQKNVPYYVIIGEGDGGCTGSEAFWKKYKCYISEMKGMGKCDRWNICRTDFSMEPKRLQHHSWTTFFHQLP